MKKKPESTMQTKQKIIEAFWELYCNKSIEKITVKEITEKAGYNRGTFYVYFKDVYDVLEQIEASLLPTEEEFDELFQCHVHNMSLEKNSSQFYEMYQQHGEKLIVLLGPNGDPHFAHRIKETVKGYLMKTMDHLSEKDRIKFDYILEYELSARYALMNRWFENKDLPLEEFAALFYHISTNGTFNTFQSIVNKTKQ
ncbi:TetR/AcrR family transcriptional regulator [Alkalicoccus daliensis]|uniref:Transcriptional regulator, TetR family n=1 Tax=Alkalicoccus daliensis TaxID=745820 RepID=A0A1H0EWS0_9BACI|nr:TetR/AcrR family transcriptional regulator [Alkalicoccus daliensis]SDN86783.1 transcriptional regulator, TetR family [Alkalicoccus daliensis]